jgi:hypothetical protein
MSEIKSMMQTLFQDKLPQELTGHICDLVTPTRKDWRTCKNEEAKHIKRVNTYLNGYIHMVFKEGEIEEMEKWSTTGKLIISKHLKRVPPRSGNPFLEQTPEKKYRAYYWTAFLLVG